MNARINPVRIDADGSQGDNDRGPERMPEAFHSAVARSSQARQSASPESRDNNRKCSGRRHIRAATEGRASSAQSSNQEQPQAALPTHDERSLEAGSVWRRCSRPPNRSGQIICSSRGLEQFGGFCSRSRAALTSFRWSRPAGCVVTMAPTSRKSGIEGNVFPTSRDVRRRIPAIFLASPDRQAPRDVAAWPARRPLHAFRLAAVAIIRKIASLSFDECFEIVYPSLAIRWPPPEARSSLSSRQSDFFRHPWRLHA